MPSSVRTRLWGGNRPGPRPQPSDPNIQAVFQEELAKGTPLNHAAVLAGIHENTAYAWRQRGEEALTQDNAQNKTLEELGSHADFAWTLKVAEAEFVSDTLEAWHDADGKQWPKYATLLERRDRANFGKQERDAQVNIGTLNVIQLSGDTLSAAQAVLQAIAQRQLGAGAPTNVIEAEVTTPTDTDDA